VEYQYTHIAPEAFDSYRIVLHGSARLGDELPPDPIPTLTEWGLIVLALCLCLGAALILIRRKEMALR
jgi:hypothetical protein